MDRLPAWERYDGVAYRVVKRLQREGEYPDSVDIRILSAKHGILTPGTEIMDYNLEMTSPIAESQAPINIGVLAALFDKRAYEEVFVFAGKTYLKALQPYGEWLPEKTKLTIAPGRIGEKLSHLKSWLIDQRDA
jgi:hypothetical protein